VTSCSPPLMYLNECASTATSSPAKDHLHPSCRWHSEKRAQLTAMGDQARQVYTTAIDHQDGQHHTA
jgi:hypothetical protein